MCPLTAELGPLAAWLYRRPSRLGQESALENWRKRIDVVDPGTALSGL
jgi:hypothetical protein